MLLTRSSQLSIFRGFNLEVYCQSSPNPLVMIKPQCAFRSLTVERKRLIDSKRAGSRGDRSYFRLCVPVWWSPNIYFCYPHCMRQVIFPVPPTSLVLSRCSSFKERFFSPSSHFFFFELFLYADGVLVSFRRTSFLFPGALLNFLATLIPFRSSFIGGSFFIPLLRIPFWAYSKKIQFC